MRFYKAALAPSLFFISAFLVFVISVAVTLIMSHAVKMIEAAAGNHLWAAARAASTLLTPEELDQFQNPVDMEKPQWESVKKRLSEFAEQYRVLYVYYWRPDGTERIQYIVDNDTDPETMANPGMFFDLEDDPITAVTVPFVLKGNPWISDLGSYTKSWGGLISGLAPVFRPDGSVYCAAGVDLSDEVIIVQRRNMIILRTILICSLALSLLSGGAGMWSYRKKAQQSDEASLAKSRFLSIMSHEIRTPMNAIIGMGELALRSGTLPQMAGHVREIKQAGLTLLSLVNDILDFSKIEAGKLEIVPVSYRLASLVYDVVNIVRMRLIEKPIRFYTNIDPSLPSGLVGDEMRIRQILLNLLNNAVKYTLKGFIGLSITAEAIGGGGRSAVSLKIEVSDSGTGIKSEDQAKLFTEFTRVDIQKNRGIEGTGLGLAITKRLCTGMGGELLVSSVYGEGSVFTAHIPQDIGSSAPFAAVVNPAKKPALVYERRQVYAQSICWSLDKLGIPYVLVTEPSVLEEELGRKDWYYVFLTRDLQGPITALLAEETARKRPSLAVFVEPGSEPESGGPLKARAVPMPVTTLALANAFNHTPDDKRYAGEEPDETAAVPFIAPEARILVVDDIEVNLLVAEGLLSPYRTVVETCLSGAEAVDLVKRRSYDLVFMDHMMPGMDGVEVVGAIRAWEAEQNASMKIPIIVLTADAVSGMREMFLEKGFSGYLSKPIEVVKLNEIMEAWIPAGKREKTRSNEPGTMIKEQESAALVIPGVDTRKGIALTGGTESGYRQVLALFRKDAAERLAFLRAGPEAEDLTLFVTQVHALKSASASIGAVEVSAEAARLEAAGKAVLQGKTSSLALVRETLPGFVERLAALAEGINEQLTMNKEQGSMNNERKNSRYSLLLDRLLGALEERNAQEIDRVLEELNQQNLESKTRKIINQIADDVLMAEYEKALEAVKKLYEGMGA